MTTYHSSSKIITGFMLIIGISVALGCVFSNPLVSFCFLAWSLCLFSDRTRAVNEQTTNNDMWVTGIALKVIIPLCTSAITAFLIITGLQGIFPSPDNNKYELPIGVTGATAIIFYVIRRLSKFFEKKNWKIDMNAPLF